MVSNIPDLLFFARNALIALVNKPRDARAGPSESDTGTVRVLSDVRRGLLRNERDTQGDDPIRALADAAGVSQLLHEEFRCRFDRDAPLVRDVEVSEQVRDGNEDVILDREAARLAGLLRKGESSREAILVLDGREQAMLFDSILKRFARRVDLTLLKVIEPGNGPLDDRCPLARCVLSAGEERAEDLGLIGLCVVMGSNDCVHRFEKGEQGHGVLGGDGIDGSGLGVAIVRVHD